MYESKWNVQTHSNQFQRRSLSLLHGAAPSISWLLNLCAFLMLHLLYYWLWICTEFTHTHTFMHRQKENHLYIPIPQTVDLSVNKKRNYLRSFRRHINTHTKTSTANFHDTIYPFGCDYHLEMWVLIAFWGVHTARLSQPRDKNYLDSFNGVFFIYTFFLWAFQLYPFHHFPSPWKIR